MHFGEPLPDSGGSLRSQPFRWVARSRVMFRIEEERSGEKDQTCPFQDFTCSFPP